MADLTNDEVLQGLRAIARTVALNSFNCPTHDPDDHLLTDQLIRLEGDIFIPGRLYTAVFEVDDTFIIYRTLDPQLAGSTFELTTIAT